MKNNAAVAPISVIGVYKSTDSGASFAKLGVVIPLWTGSTGSLASDASFAIDAADPRGAYVAVRAQLWYTPDGGATWSSPVALPGGASDIRL